MAAAAKLGKPHGMLSIIGLEDKPLEDICAQVRANLGGDVVCQLANYLFPTGRVVSGHNEALAQVQVQMWPWSAQDRLHHWCFWEGGSGVGSLLPNSLPMGWCAGACDKSRGPEVRAVSRERSVPHPPHGARQGSACQGNTTF